MEFKYFGLGQLIVVLLVIGEYLILLPWSWIMYAIPLALVVLAVGNHLDYIRFKRIHGS